MPGPPRAKVGSSAHGTIVFFHPDLGIGGAERLVVDAAVGLQDRGHRVVIFTNHCDPKHCFDECRDGTLDVRVRASSPIPMSILSRLTILCAILRHIHLLLLIHFNGELASLRPRAFVVDQLSAGLPLMRLLCPSAPILFYCHFPDMLLARGRESALKRMYRVPFDTLEGWSMGFASSVAVNSGFTKGVVSKVWPSLAEKGRIDVIYPCVDTGDDAAAKLVDEKDIKFLEGEKIILSINRFERKKDIALAIKAFAAIPKEERKDARLVLAGGYDARIAENVDYHRELQSLASSLSLSHHTLTPTALSTFTTSSTSDIPSSANVIFLLSVPSTLKSSLLRSSTLLVYTPSNEHFGIVPLEAMLARLPVLAANTGGPVETVVDFDSSASKSENPTGWLRSPDDTPAWTQVIRKALSMPDAELAKMGADGASRVRSLFGREHMAERLEASVDEIAPLGRPLEPGLDLTMLLVAAVAAALFSVFLVWLFSGVVSRSHGA